MLVVQKTEVFTLKKMYERAKSLKKEWKTGNKKGLHVICNVFKITYFLLLYVLLTYFVSMGFASLYCFLSSWL